MTFLQLVILLYKSLKFTKVMCSTINFQRSLNWDFWLNVELLIFVKFLINWRPWGPQGIAMGSKGGFLWDPMGGGPMGSHGGNPWDPRVGPWGPIGPWGPNGPLGTRALGDPLALGDYYRNFPPLGNKMLCNWFRIRIDFSPPYYSDYYCYYSYYYYYYFFIMSVLFLIFDFAWKLWLFLTATLI